MVERQKEIRDQKNTLISMLGSDKGGLENREALLAGVGELSKLNAQEFGKKLE